LWRVNVKFFDRLLAIDRRIIFLLVAIAVTLPLFSKAILHIEVSPTVKAVYDAVESLPAGSKVLVSFDYDPASAPELQPMALSFFRHCFSKDLKVIIIGLWPQGPVQANIALEDVFRDPEIEAKNLEYGEDYVNLGYMAGNEVVIQGMGADIHTTFPADYSGNRTSELSLMKGVKNFDNIDFVYNLSAGYPGTQEWVQFAVDRFHATLGAGNTAVQAPGMYPYVQTGQLLGVLGGMKGGAEYEIIAKRPARAVSYMFSQSVSHAVVVFFIIVGNLAFFATRGKRKTSE
jgi:hypothetical protein